MRHIIQSGVIVVALVSSLAVFGPARADIITSLSAVPTAVAGGYSYTYNVQLSGGQLDPVGSVDRDGNPVRPQFGTVYDFGQSFGTISTTGYMDRFTWSMAALDTPASQTLPNDSPGLANIRFTYNSINAFAVQGSDTTFDDAAIVLPAGSDNLGTFTINSPFGPTLSTSIQYDGQSYKGSNNTLQSNIGFTSGPLVPAQVPEPASMALLGLGLLGAGVMRRTRG